MLERMDPAILRAKRRQRDVARRLVIGGSCRLARANGAASEPPSPAIERSARAEDAALEGVQGAEETPTCTENLWAASFTARQRHRRAEQVRRLSSLSSGEKLNDFLIARAQRRRRQHEAEAAAAVARRRAVTATEEDAAAAAAASVARTDTLAAARTAWHLGSAAVLLAAETGMPPAAIPGSRSGGAAASAAAPSADYPADSRQPAGGSGCGLTPPPRPSNSRRYTGRKQEQAWSSDVESMVRMRPAAAACG